MQDLFADKRNTLHLKKYTWLLFFFYLFTSVNFCVTAAMSRGADAILLRAAWAMGILFLLLTPVAAADKRRANRSLGAVIGGGAVHCFCTVMCAVVFSLPQLLFAYIGELLVCLVCAFTCRTEK